MVIEVYVRWYMDIVCMCGRLLFVVVIVVYLFMHCVYGEGTITIGFSNVHLVVFQRRSIRFSKNWIYVM